MIHYVSLLRESVIGGMESWIVKDFVLGDKDPNLVPDLAGLARELQNDNLDYERVIDYLKEYKWDEITQLSRPVENQEGEITLNPVSSGPIVSWTITEFLQAKGGAITGIFFSTDGTYIRIQKYFYDRTRWQFAK